MMAVPTIAEQGGHTVVAGKLTIKAVIRRKLPLMGPCSDVEGEIVMIVKRVRQV
jgi:hypothetical protein